MMGAPVEWASVRSQAEPAETLMAMIRNIKILASCVLLSVLTAELRAERKYVIGTGVSFMAGGSTYADGSLVDSGQLPIKFSPFVASYPSIEIRSTGRNSVLDLSYTFG